MTGVRKVRNVKLSKITIFTSALAGFRAVVSLWKTEEKSLGQGENQQQTKPTYGAEPKSNRTRAMLVGG